MGEVEMLAFVRQVLSLIEEYPIVATIIVVAVLFLIFKSTAEKPVVFDGSIPSGDRMEMETEDDEEAGPLGTLRVLDATGVQKTASVYDETPDWSFDEEANEAIISFVASPDGDDEETTLAAEEVVVYAEHEADEDSDPDEEWVIIAVNQEGVVVFREVYLADDAPDTSDNYAVVEDHAHHRVEIYAGAGLALAAIRRRSAPAAKAAA